MSHKLDPLLLALKMELETIPGAIATISSESVVSGQSKMFVGVIAVDSKFDIELAGFIPHTVKQMMKTHYRTIPQYNVTFSYKGPRRGLIISAKRADVFEVICVGVMEAIAKTKRFIKSVHGYTLVESLGYIYNPKINGVYVTNRLSGRLSLHKH